MKSIIDDLRRENNELRVSSLTGALKIHEIFIGEDLVVKKKMLPSDPFYKAVLIKESRKKSTGTNVLDDDNYDSD